MHQLRDWTKFLQPVSFYVILASMNLKNSKCKIHAVVSNDGLQIWQNPVHLLNWQTHPETVVCILKQPNRRGFWAFFQCKTIFVHLLHFKSFKLVTVLQSNTISCHQKDLLWPFSYLPSSLMKKQKNSVMWESQQSRKDTLQQLLGL